jgi:hypothetical protein
MGEYLLRYEASEFDATVFDLAQLSAIRGASLALHYSEHLVNRVIKHHVPGFKVVFSGASQGAYRFEADAAAAKLVLAEVRYALQKNDGDTGPHHHLAYVVDMVEFEDLPTALAEATALNDAQKLQSEGWPLPAFNVGVSSFDAIGGRMRPADVSGYKVGGEKQNVSAAFEARHRFGHKARRAFYGEIIEEKLDVDVVEDFHEMVKDADERLPLSVKNKIGVFYADGNGLGSHAEASLQAGNLDKYSEQLKAHQKALMQRILDWRAKNDFHYYGSNWRFETLLWGGDEVCFAMPAWLALDFADMFFEATAGWNVLGKPITQAAGLVVCSFKTPIRQAKNVAEDLAEICKNTSKAESLLQIEVFESLSLPDSDLGKYRQKLYGANSETLGKQCAIKGSDFSGFLDRLRYLKSSDKPLPRSQVYKLLRKGVSDEELKQAYLEYYVLAGKDRAPDEASLHVVKPIDGIENPDFKLQLGMISMLWDYVDPCNFPEAQS